MRIGDQVVELSREEVFRTTAVLALIILGIFLGLLYSSSLADYQEVVGSAPCTAVAFPRCYEDLVHMNQIGLLGGTCIALIVLGVLLSLRVKGAFYVAVLIADLLMASYVVSFFL